MQTQSSASQLVVNKYLGSDISVQIFAWLFQIFDVENCDMYITSTLYGIKMLLKHDKYLF